MTFLDYFSCAWVIQHRIWRWAAAIVCVLIEQVSALWDRTGNAEGVIAEGVPAPQRTGASANRALRAIVHPTSDYLGVGGVSSVGLPEIVVRTKHVSAAVNLVRYAVRRTDVLVYFLSLLVRVAGGERILEPLKDFLRAVHRPRDVDKLVLAHCNRGVSIRAAEAAAAAVAIVVEGLKSSAALQGELGAHMGALPNAGFVYSLLKGEGSEEGIGGTRDAVLEYMRKVQQDGDGEQVLQALKVWERVVGAMKLAFVIVLAHRRNVGVTAARGPVADGDLRKRGLKLAGLPDMRGEEEDISRVRDYLYFGGTKAARVSAGVLHAKWVSVVVNLAPHHVPTVDVPAEHVSLSAQAEDGNAFLEILPDVLAAARRARDAGVAALVHCKDGNNLSTAAAAAVLMVEEGWGCAAALEQVRFARQGAEPCAGLVSALQQLENGRRGTRVLVPFAAAQEEAEEYVSHLAEVRRVTMPMDASTTRTTRGDGFGMEGDTPPMFVSKTWCVVFAFMATACVVGMKLFRKKW